MDTATGEILREAVARGTPLGLEDWMLEAGCLLALGDGAGLNFATPDSEIAERLRARFKPARGR